jgi:hypothetical protein
MSAKCLLRRCNLVARAYAMEGDRENSRRAYDEFFTIRRDADADMPIRRQAKAEYKKLTASAFDAARTSGNT